MPSSPMSVLVETFFKQTHASSRPYNDEGVASPPIVEAVPNSCVAWLRLVDRPPDPRGFAFGQREEMRARRTLFDRKRFAGERTAAAEYRLAHGRTAPSL